MLDEKVIKTVEENEKESQNLGVEETLEEKTTELEEKVVEVDENVSNEKEEVVENLLKEEVENSEEKIIEMFDKDISEENTSETVKETEPNVLEQNEEVKSNEETTEYFKALYKTKETEIENRVIKDFLEGKSIDDICAELNEENIRNEVGDIKTWTAKKVKNIIEKSKVKEATKRKKLSKKVANKENNKEINKQEEDTNIKELNKQEQNTNKAKETKNKKGNKKISKEAKKTRRIIFLVTLYLDALFIFLFVAGGYLNVFLNGAGDFVKNLLNDANFTTACLLIVLLLIINIVSLGLYKDAAKTRGKKEANLLPMLNEMENVDGRREEEEELQEEVKGPVYRKSKTIESINIKKVQDELIDAALESGIVIDRKTTRNLLAAIAGSQLIFVKEENKQLCNKFLKVLSEFFGVEYFSTNVKDSTNSFDAISKYSDGKSSLLTPFAKSIIAANQLPESINLSVLINVDPSNMMSYFKDVFGQVKNPNLDNVVKLGARSNISAFRNIPKNFWTICVVKNNEFEMPSEVAKYSIILDLNLKESEEVIEPKKRKAISYPQLLDCISELYEMCYIEEDVWKHLDEFEEYLGARGEYAVDNRMIRQMERFAAIYLALDGEQTDVIDTLLTQKLLLVAIPNEYNKLDPSEENVVGTAEKILGADYIAYSQELLKKIKMN